MHAIFSFSASALVVSVFLFFPYAALGAASSRFETASLEPLDNRLQDDLSSMLRRAPFHEARIFEVAWRQIREIESSPACHQLATSALLDSCQSFSSMPGQDATGPAENTLDQVRQEYAARLAVCELQGIKSGIPRECTPFVPSRKACPKINSKGFFRKDVSSHDEPTRACYPDYTFSQLNRCIDTLFDQAQRWTSYSNAQTNALVICQASRGALENEEHLQKIKEAFRSQAKVSEVLSRAVQETEERLAQHHSFTETVQQFQHDLAARNEAALTRADSMITLLVGKFDSATEALLGIFSRSLKTATKETEDLSDNIKHANGELYKARTALQDLHDEAVHRDKQRSAMQDLALQNNQVLASDVQASLVSVRDVTVQALAERLRGVETAVIHYLNTQQQALEDQQVFQEAQSRIMNNQLLIETSLTSQHEIIEEQSHKIAELTFGGLSNIISTYIGLAFFIILLSRASLVLAAAAATGVGLVGMTGLAPFNQLSSSISPTHWTIPPWVLCVAGYATGFAIAAAFISGTIISSLLIRNFIISHISSGAMLGIEVKRETTPYDV